MSDCWRALAMAVAVLVAPCAAAQVPRGVSRRVIKTSDGVRIAMFRYAAPSASAERPVVVLVSDVGFNSRAFDLQGDGLAQLLARHGLETFSFDWRGTGSSEVPPSFGLADLAERDLAAVVDAVVAQRVVLVGWGIGGTLAIAYAAHSPERIAGVVALASPLDLDEPNVIVKRWVHELPLQGLTQLPGAGDRGEDAAVFNLLYAHGNALTPEMVELIRHRVTGPISARLARDLADWMHSGDTVLFGRGLHELAKGLDRPVLLFLAPLDNWTHPEFAEPWQDELPRLTVTPLSWVDGYREDYGHLGMLFAKDAPGRIHGRIAKFADDPLVSP
jgi:pimeloyl-ACP methyl ester carboxylesterase